MSAVEISSLPVDDKRGKQGMYLFILSELVVFVCLFFSYFYVGHHHSDWPPSPPKVKLALILLAILLTSSVVLHAAEKVHKEGSHRLARALLGLTILLGIAFLLVQAKEYANHLEELTPTQNAYGSLFYTVTSFHAAHLILGLFMLIFAFVLPHREPRVESPHKPLHNAAMYWHFVDAIWVLIVGLLYLLPHLTRGTP